MQTTVHNIEAYIGIQMLCCFKWRDYKGKSFLLGWDESRLMKFQNQFGKVGGKKMIPLFRKIKYDIDNARHGELAGKYELIEEYTRLIPPPYRHSALKRCQLLVGNTVFSGDRDMLKRIERKLVSL